MFQAPFLERLQTLLDRSTDCAQASKQVAESIAAERNYRWVGLYSVSKTQIAMIACTGKTPPAFPALPVTQGLCGAAVAERQIVNVGEVQNDPRWLTTFGSTRSEIIVPVYRLDGSVTGLIDVESDQLDAFSKDDERFLSSCAPLLLLLFD
jgi:L-methionine (R)-S-oxide reductase